MSETPDAADPDPLELMKSLEVTVEPGLLFQALTHRSYALPPPPTPSPQGGV